MSISTFLSLDFIIYMGFETIGCLLTGTVRQLFLEMSKPSDSKSDWRLVVRSRGFGAVTVYFSFYHWILCWVKNLDISEFQPCENAQFRSLKVLRVIRKQNSVGFAVGTRKLSRIIFESFPPGIYNLKSLVCL